MHVIRFATTTTIIPSLSSLHGEHIVSYNLLALNLFAWDRCDAPKQGFGSTNN
jgi:hypothetical protein